MTNSNIPDAAESLRLDALTAYTSTILNHLSGAELDKVAKRRGQTDAQVRARVLAHTHPDDLAADLAAAGFTLASFGIDSIVLG